MPTLASRLVASLLCPAIAALTVLTAAIALIGWQQNYHAIGAYVVFLLLTGLTIAAARNLVDGLFMPASDLDRFVFTAVVSFAMVVAWGLIFGLIGRITIASYLLAQAALFAWSLHFSVRRVTHMSAEWAVMPPWVVGLVGALLAIASAFAFAHAPLTLYDSLSYHLFFPARWLQEQALSIIPTPFSDQAQAYAPANGELFFLWLMLPFHGDLLARIGQLPFALLAAVTVYALARKLGARPEHAVYPAAFLLLSRPLLEQAIGANVDLVCAATFLTSLYLGLVAFERDRTRDWLLWGVSLGLCFGSKYVALIYVPVVLVFAVAGRPRLKMLWAAVGIVAFALPWYARNWMIAGSPIYPASLTLAGVTVAQGAFDRLAMLNTVFHTTETRLFPVIAAHAFGPTLFLIWLPAALVGGIALVRRGWWPHTVVALLPYVMAPLFWLALPVNIDSRFLMPAVLPALLPFAFVFGRSRVWNAGIHATYLASMVWILIGARTVIHASVPWFMDGWLTLSGLLTPDAVVWCAALAGLITAAWWAGPRRTRWAVSFAVALVSTAATALAMGSERWCGPAPCRYLDTTSPYIRANLIVGWRWVADHVRDATIAYTGINLPYPLTGAALTNRVVYVNIDGRPGWRFHDYERAYRTGRFAPAPPLLATRSGELLPLSARFGSSAGAIRPRYERMEGVREAWIDNLRRFRVEYLFVSALSAYEIDNVWHNHRGFPIEDEWAGADPQLFHLEYENPQVRIFSIDLEEDAQ